MSEPLARARRVVAVGAAALAVVIVALAAAAWRLVEAETESAEVRGRFAAQFAVDDLMRAIASKQAEQSFLSLMRGAVEVDSDGAVIYPALPVAFAPSPVGDDSEGAFLISEARRFTGPLARAALRRAATSDDPATRVLAAAEGARLELRDGTGRAAEWTTAARLDRPFPSPPGATTHGANWLSLVASREGVFLNLVASSKEARQLALAAVGSPDDIEAAAMLATLAPDEMSSVRRRRTELAEAGVLVPAFRAAPEYEGRLRASMLVGGDALAAVKERGRWTVVRVPMSDVRTIARGVLSPRRMALVEGAAAADPAAVSLPGAGRLAVVPSFSETETRSRSTLLLSGLGVAAGAAVLAFVAFARSATREARLAALRTDFVATVSHELRTPVAVVRTSAETLASGRATRDADKQALTEAIVRESERLSTLVGNVLDFARMESGRRTYAMLTADVGALVRDVASRHAGVTVDVAADVPPIACDADALGGAVGNLLDNARKYSSPDAPVVARVARRGGDVVVEVEDHGIGVPDAEKRHVFERFFRGADPRVRDTRGAGIGLALVEHAARAHGGRAEVVDTPGGGATFRIALPIAQNG